jgi:hypothetical protein
LCEAVLVIWNYSPVELVPLFFQHFLKDFITWYVAPDPILSPFPYLLIITQNLKIISKKRIINVKIVILTS